MAGGAETIVAQDLILDLGEPIVVGLPNPSGDYFLVAWAAVGTLRAKPYIANETIYYVTPPKSRSQSNPIFPRS